MIIWSVIAVALVKFAFFPNQADQVELNPQGVFELPSVSPERADIENTISLNATILRDESSAIKATQSGEVVWLFVDNGATVEEGAKILQVKKTTTVEPSNPEEMPYSKETYHDVYSPAAGTLTLDALVGQPVEIGQAIGSIVPDTFHAQVPVTPDQLYTLQSLPDSATLSIKDGPAPFDCTGLKTVSVHVTSSRDDGENSGQSGPQLRCSIPSNQTVFDGVKGSLEIAGGQVTDVLTLPVTAVEGRFREGIVYIPGDSPTGKPTKKTVSLGLTDGQRIEITEGLSESDVVLEFVPRTDHEEEEQSEYLGG
ncbi:MAG: efflux RND transporter periplasmic adaptor subunit [Actinomycetaceae bacterium]|nr:efflux RND transporter periplasmic adaptor subunit [Actinomycetaceae bacterium]